MPLPAAEPGQTVMVSVPRAPSTPGSYRTNWRLSVADGTYGTTIYAVIEATEPIATPTPEASPTPTASPTPLVAAASTEVVSTETQPSAAVTAATPQADEGIRAVIAYDEKGLWITTERLRLAQCLSSQSRSFAAAMSQRSLCSRRASGPFGPPTTCAALTVRPGPPRKRRSRIFCWRTRRLVAGPTGE